VRPNERFSGGGHKRHVCRDCSRLGPAELAVRQKIRNLERLLHDGLVPRKRRIIFQRALQDPEPRVRAYAQEMLAHTDIERLIWAVYQELDDRLHEGFRPAVVGPDPGIEECDSAGLDGDYDLLFWYPDHAEDEDDSAGLDGDELPF